MTPIDGTAIWIFVGAAMLLAAADGYGGCELMVFANAAARRRYQVGCPLYGPIDAAEARLANAPGATLDQGGGMPSAAQENLETVMIDFFGALRGGDFDAASALLDPAVTWQGLRTEWTCHGREEVVDVLRSGLHEHREADALEFIRGGDTPHRRPPPSNRGSGTAGAADAGWR